MQLTTLVSINENISKTGRNQPKSAILGRTSEVLNAFWFYRPFPTNRLRVWMRFDTAALYMSKSHTYFFHVNYSKTKRPSISIVLPISSSICRLGQVEKSPAENTESNRAKYYLKKKKHNVLIPASERDSWRVSWVFRTTYPSPRNLKLGVGDISYYSRWADCIIPRYK